LCESGKNGYIDEGDFFMDVPYSFFQGDKFLIGYIDGYPQYPTQGKNIEDLEKHLIEIHRWLRDGSLNSREQKGILRNVP
jgi:hypothetical protein